MLLPVFEREPSENGLSGIRDTSPSLLFVTLITVSGLYFYLPHSKTWLLAFSCGTFTDLILEQIQNGLREKGQADYLEESG